MGLLALLVLVGCGSPVSSGLPHSSVVTSIPTPVIVEEPKHISIPAIEAESDLIKTGLLPDGTLEVPSIKQPLQASWYGRFAKPGEAGRPAVLLGHVDGGGQKGIFYRLHELRVGTQVHVDDKTFTVYQVEKVAKDDFPTERVYSPTEAPELRLITCGGVFDHSTGNYKDNWVIFARMDA